EQRQKQAQQQREKNRRKTRLPRNSKLLKKKMDPVAVLPAEIMGMVLHYQPDIKGVIALERVSKRWAQIIATVCTPAWIVQYWGIDADWAQNEMGDEAVEDSRRTDWQRVKAEGITGLFFCGT